MDIEFHYYINYMIALRAGLSPEAAYKIAYSAQYIDDNTEYYTILQKDSLAQYNNIITQSMSPVLSVKDTISIYPVFHFIPGNDVLRSSALRIDGQWRYMTTTPDNKIAKNCLKSALKSGDPCWAGIASHAYADTWAHQNFTGLKDSYNTVDKQSNILSLKGHVGHASVLHAPDNPSSIWYDYRLKDMKIDNAERFLEAAKSLFKMYLKYAHSSMVLNKPKHPEAVWKELKMTLHAIFKNDFKHLQKVFGKYCGAKSNSNFLIMKILGMNRLHRVNIYQNLIRNYHLEMRLNYTTFEKYDATRWVNNAFYEVSDSICNYEVNTANDNEKHVQKEAQALCDSAKLGYQHDLGDQIKRKITSLLGICNKLYMWKDNEKSSDWYNFQQAAKKQHEYMIDKVIEIMRKDIDAMKRSNL